MYTLVIQESVKDLFHFEGSEELAELFDHFFETGDPEAFDIITQLVEPYYEANLEIMNEMIDIDSNLSFDDLFEGICYGYVDLGGTLYEADMKEIGRKIWKAKEAVSGAIRHPGSAVRSISSTIANKYKTNRSINALKKDLGKKQKSQFSVLEPTRMDKIKSMFKNKINAAKDASSKAYGAVKSAPGNAYGAVKNKINAAKASVGSGASTVAAKFKAAKKSARNAAKAVASAPGKVRQGLSDLKSGYGENNAYVKRGQEIAAQHESDTTWMGRKLF